MDQAEAFMFQNPEHLEELLKVVNKHPKKLSELNDIMRLKEMYTSTKTKWSKHIRQNIIVQKFKSQELQFIYSEFCSSNILGSI